MTKAPAFQFYAADFLSDANVMAMTMEERGVYITLLCIAWKEGGIPKDRKRLAAVLGIDTRRLAKLWRGLAPCWQESGSGQLVNKRLERERQNSADYRERARAAGKRGAEARWNRSGKPTE